MHREFIEYQSTPGGGIDIHSGQRVRYTYEQRDDGQYTEKEREILGPATIKGTMAGQSAQPDDMDTKPVQPIRQRVGVASVTDVTRDATGDVVDSKQLQDVLGMEPDPDVDVRLNTTNAVLDSDDPVVAVDPPDLSDPAVDDPTLNPVVSPVPAPVVAPDPMTSIEQLAAQLEAARQRANEGEAAQAALAAGASLSDATKAHLQNEVAEGARAKASLDKISAALGVQDATVGARIAASPQPVRKVRQIINDERAKYTGRWRTLRFMWHWHTKTIVKSALVGAGMGALMTASLGTGLAASGLAGAAVGLVRTHGNFQTARNILLKDINQAERSGDRAKADQLRYELDNLRLKDNIGLALMNVALGAGGAMGGYYLMSDAGLGGAQKIREITKTWLVDAYTTGVPGKSAAVQSNPLSRMGEGLLAQQGAPRPPAATNEVYQSVQARIQAMHQRLIEELAQRASAAKGPGISDLGASIGNPAAPSGQTLGDLGASITQSPDTSLGDLGASITAARVPDNFGHNLRFSPTEIGYPVVAGSGADTHGLTGFLQQVATGGRQFVFSRMVNGYGMGNAQANQLFAGIQELVDANPQYQNLLIGHAGVDQNGHILIKPGDRISLLNLFHDKAFQDDLIARIENRNHPNGSFTRLRELLQYQGGVGRFVKMMGGRLEDLRAPRTV